MEQVIAFLSIAVLLAAGTWFQYRLSRGRMWHPLWLAFSMTFAAILFLVSGSLGYRLERRVSILAANRWAGGVIWWEIQLGLIFFVLAVIFWRLAIRDTDRRLGRY